jgi:thiol-disulfide isomerase/thioredoxin
MTDQQTPLPEPPGAPAGAAVPPVAPRGRTSALWVGLAVLVAALVLLAVVLSEGGADPATSASSSASASAAPDGSASIGSVSVTGAAPVRGRPMPEWQAPSLGGGTMRWSDPPGAPTVLAVWAPWCPHCQAELPRLSAAVGSHPSVRFVTVATAIDPATGPTPGEYMAAEGLSFPVALDDAAGTLMAGLGVRGFPTTFFVAGDGTLLASAEGELDPAALEEALSALEGS